MGLDFPFNSMGPTFYFGMIVAPILLTHAHGFDDTSGLSCENVEPLQLNPARNSAGFSQGRLPSCSQAKHCHLICNMANIELSLLYILRWAALACRLEAYAGASLCECFKCTN